MQIAEVIDFHATLSPGKPAIASPGGLVSYAMLKRAIDAAAGVLFASGVQTGDVVGVCARNGFYALVATVAAWRLGAAAVILPAHVGADELGFPVAKWVTDGVGGPNPAASLRIDESWLTARHRLPPPPPWAPDQIQQIILSSGTTGLPKATALSAGILGRRILRQQLGSLAAGERALSLIGLSTSYGLQHALATLCGGGLLCFAPSLDDALEMTAFFQLTKLSLSPVQMRDLLRGPRLRAFDYSSLRSVWIGGSKFAWDPVHQLQQRMCANVNCVYGSTEASYVAYAPANLIDHLDGATGFLLPWIDLQIVNEHGTAVPAGVEGVIRIRGDDVVVNYVGETRGGADGDNVWFYPGDIGYVTPERLLVVTARTTELINQGGVKIAPDRIDQTLQAYPEVADAAAFGVVIQAVEEIWAALVAPEGFNTERLLHYCKQRLGEASPIRLLRVDAIPRTAMGKVNREALKQLAADDTSR